MKLTKHKIWLGTAWAAVFLIPAATAGPAAGKPAKEKAPVAWGVLSDYSGCVIFNETRHRHVEFVGVLIVRWNRTLDVFESHRYDMKRKQWKETREDLDDLQKLALRDKVKLVKIPVGHTEQQLEEARGMCRASSSAPHEDPGRGASRPPSGESRFPVPALLPGPSP